MLPSGCLGEIGGVIDQRVQPPAGDPLDLWQRIPHHVDIRQIELDVVTLAARPRAARIERVAGDGQHPPAVAAEALDGGMTDAAAGAGQQQNGLLPGLELELDMIEILRAALE